MNEVSQGLRDILGDVVVNDKPSFLELKERLNKTPRGTMVRVYDGRRGIDVDFTVDSAIGFLEASGKQNSDIHYVTHAIGSNGTTVHRTRAGLVCRRGNIYLGFKVPYKE